MMDIITGRAPPPAREVASIALEARLAEEHDSPTSLPFQLRAGHSAITCVEAFVVEYVVLDNM